MFDLKKMQREEVVLFGAGGSGKVILKICLENEIKVKYFCDNQQSKIDTIYEGYPVKSLAFIKEERSNSIMIISAQGDFAGEIYKQLYLEGFDQDKIYFCHDVFAFAYDKRDIPVISSVAAYRRRFALINEISMPSAQVIADVIDLTITEKCSLKCKDCSNLMQYFEKPEHVSTDVLYQSIDKIDEIFAFVNDLRILGGEPLINPDMYKVVNYATGKRNIEHVIILSNATIPLKEEELKKLDKDKVGFIFSDYGSYSKYLTHNTELLDQYKLAYAVLSIDSWSDCAGFEYQNYSEEQLKEVFCKCCVSSYGVLSDGKMYHCPYAASADRLHALPKETAEYIDLLQDKGDMDSFRQSIKEFLYHKEYLEVCRYCKGRDPENPVSVEPAVQTSKPLTYQKY